MYQKEICQYMSKDYCITCFIKKEKYANCKDLLLKCTNNSNYIFFKEIKLINKY